MHQHLVHECMNASTLLSSYHVLCRPSSPLVNCGYLHFKKALTNQFFVWPSLGHVYPMQRAPGAPWVPPGCPLDAPRKGRGMKDEGEERGVAKPAVGCTGPPIDLNFLILFFKVLRLALGLSSPHRPHKHAHLPLRRNMSSELPSTVGMVRQVLQFASRPFCSHIHAPLVDS